MNSHFQRLLGPNNFSIGLELPLDNDWSTAGQRLRMSERYAALRRSSRYARKIHWVMSVRHCPLTAVPLQLIPPRGERSDHALYLGQCA